MNAEKYDNIERKMYDLKTPILMLNAQFNAFSIRSYIDYPEALLMFGVNLHTQLN